MYSCLLRSVSGHVVVDDHLGEALDDRRLADARLADQHRVVLRAPGEDLHDPLELAGAADDRVELALAGELREVAAELVEDLAVALVALGVLLGGAADVGAGGAGRRALAAPGGALVAGEELDDLLADAGQVGAELDEDLGGDALALADQAEQDVLGADVVVAELQRLAQRQLEDLLGAGGEGDVPGRRRAALADDLLDLAADGLERDAEALEGLGGDAFALVDQAEQDVLGPDVAVVEQARFLLGEDDDPAGPVGETFEHVRPFQRGTTFVQCTGEAHARSGWPSRPERGPSWVAPVTARPRVLGVIRDRGWRGCTDPSGRSAAGRGPPVTPAAERDTHWVRAAPGVTERSGRGRCRTGTRLPRT